MARAPAETLAGASSAVAARSGIKAGVLGRRSQTFYTDESLNRHEDRSTLARVLGVPAARIAQVQQVHGTEVVWPEEVDPRLAHSTGHTAARVTSQTDSTPENAQPGPPLLPAEGDALFTSQTNLVLCIRTADCVPIFLWHKSQPLVGIIHAGWRGLAAGIIPRTLAALPCRSSDLQAWIGPAISVQAYEVGQQTAAHFPGAVDTGGRFFVDLAAHATAQLQSSGVLVECSNQCTFSDNEQYYSHRRGDPQRNLNYIMLENPKSH